MLQCMIGHIRVCSGMLGGVLECEVYHRAYNRAYYRAYDRA